MSWTLALVVAVVLLLLVLLGFGAWGLSHRQSAGPPARPLRPVLAGPGRRAGPPGRGGPRGRGRTRSAARLTLRPGSWSRGPTRRKPPHGEAREACENKLSAALASVDPAAVPAGLIAELADAEARVVLARRFHNDAVRDTLALRERRLVRLFRLAGTAALPSYFEIAERVAGATPRRSSRSRPAHVGAGGVARRDRRGVAAVRIGPRSVRAGRRRAAMVVHRGRSGRRRGVLGAGRGS